MHAATLKTIKELILGARAVLDDLELKDVKICPVDILAEKLMETPEHITSWQRSSAIGAARQALFLTLCHYPEVEPPPFSLSFRLVSIPVLLGRGRMAMIL